MSESPESGGVAPDGPRHVRRLVFSYDGDEVELVSEQTIEMTAPPQDEVDNPEERAGFFLELRDTRDRVLYRKVLYHPLQHDAEVFSANPSQPMVRHPIETPTGVFVVLVPDMPDAEEVVLHASPDRPDPSIGPLRELKRFRLRERER
jgi:hypothetical protein